ncbi:MAG TPA: DUF424 domain-containing protein [Nitrososphaerales archaeon]|nr:DUF424 domain-containing protein [Nitrososphaerales archaeon]
MSTASFKESTLVNICDEELLGRTVTEGRLQVKISKEFYCKEIVDEWKALQLIKQCSIVNLAGDRSVALALRNKIGAEQAIRKIEGVPFLMIYKFLR